MFDEGYSCRNEVKVDKLKTDDTILAHSRTYAQNPNPDENSSGLKTRPGHDSTRQQILGSTSMILRTV
jgi:hypothetical protein